MSETNRRKQARNNIIINNGTLVIYAIFHVKLWLLKNENNFVLTIVLVVLTAPHNFMFSQSNLNAHIKWKYLSHSIRRSEYNYDRSGRWIKFIFHVVIFENSRIDRTEKSRIGNPTVRRVKKTIKTIHHRKMIKTR